MLSTACRRRVILALMILAIALTVLITLAIFGPEIYLALPGNIQLK